MKYLLINLLFFFCVWKIHFHTTDWYNLTAITPITRPSFKYKQVSILLTLLRRVYFALNFKLISGRIVIKKNVQLKINSSSMRIYENTLYMTSLHHKQNSSENIAFWNNHYWSHIQNKSTHLCWVPAPHSRPSAAHRTGGGKPRWHIWLLWNKKGGLSKRLLTEEVLRTIGESFSSYSTYGSQTGLR